VALDLTHSLAITIDLEVLHLGLLVLLLAGPLKRLGPRLVAEPVADVISIASVDQDWNLLEDGGHDAVVRLHPVALEQEVAVDVEIAGLVVGDLCANGLHDLLLVEVALYPVKLVVAEAVAAAWLAHVVYVLAGALVRANHSVVTVDGSGHAGPDGLGLVAVLDQAGAARVGVVHGGALALAKDGGPATITAGHGAVVLVLGEAIGQTVADEDGLQVDVALLVRENLGREDGDVVPGVRLARDVEGLLGVLGELLEEEGEQGVDVLAGGDSVAD